MDWFINLMLKICNLTDNSFFHLFGFYMVIYIVWAIIAKNIESYFGIENKVYLYDLILLFILFGIFAFNSYWLSNIKAHEAGKAYTLTKEKKQKD